MNRNGGGFDLKRSDSAMDVKETVRPRGHRRRNRKVTTPSTTVKATAGQLVGVVSSVAGMVGGQSRNARIDSKEREQTRILSKGVQGHQVMKNRAAIQVCDEVEPARALVSP